MLALALCFIAAPAIAESERFRDDASEITVLTHGSLTIVETMTVVATGNRIKRGIYRDFPTDYTDSHRSPHPRVCSGSPSDQTDSSKGNKVITSSCMLHLQFVKDGNGVPDPLFR